MSRTTATLVKGIMQTSLEDADIAPFIAVANRLVTAKLSTSSLASDTLTDIETYLTAHLIAIGKERQAMTEKIGDVSLTYQGKFEDFLKLTTYGQMVLMLDETGILTTIGLKKAKIRAIPQDSDGTSPNLDY